MYFICLETWIPLDNHNGTWWMRSDTLIIFIVFIFSGQLKVELISVANWRNKTIDELYLDPPNMEEYSPVEYTFRGKLEYMARTVIYLSKQTHLCKHQIIFNGSMWTTLENFKRSFPTWKLSVYWYPLQHTKLPRNVMAFTITISINYSMTSASQKYRWPLSIWAQRLSWDCSQLRLLGKLLISGQVRWSWLLAGDLSFSVCEPLQKDAWKSPRMLPDFT